MEIFDIHEDNTENKKVCSKNNEANTDNKFVQIINNDNHANEFAKTAACVLS
jgi:hypothetical protein